MKLNKQQLKQDLQNSLIPVADHIFEVVSCDKTSSQKTTDGEMFKLTVVVMVNGRKRKIKTVLGQWLNGGSKMYKGFLDSVGLDDEGDYTADEFIGLTGRLHNGHGEFNGKPQDKVAWWIPLKPGQKSPVLGEDQQTEEEGDEFDDTAKEADDDLPF